MTGASGSRAAELRAAGEAVRARPAASVIAGLDAACARWRDPSDPDRAAGERALAAHHGVPRAAIATVLDAAFGGWDRAAMRRWVEGELGALEVLDRPVRRGGAGRMAVGPELAVVLCARGVPTTPVADLLAALLVKAPVWLKPAAGADDLAARFAATLAAVDPELGGAVEARGWARGSPAEAEALGAAEVVVATGRGETLAAVRAAAPAARLVLHGPRLSAAVVPREALADRESVVASLADDAAFAGGAGCLSPVVAWIEAPAAVVADMAAPVHAACEERWPAAPRADAPERERARFAEWLALADVERAAGATGAVVGGFDGAWIVQARTGAAPLDPPPVPRLLVLAPVADPAETVRACERRRGLVATVGIAGGAGNRAELRKDRTEELAIGLARAGVERVAPLGAMQRPPLDWRRDGRATLADLVRWFDREA